MDINWQDIRTMGEGERLAMLVAIGTGCKVTGGKTATGVCAVVLKPAHGQSYVFRPEKAWEFVLALPDDDILSAAIEHVIGAMVSQYGIDHPGRGSQAKMAG